MNTYLSLQNLSFSFEQANRKFFDDISLRIPEPGLIFVIGKNGVGKSTFLRLLQGIVYDGEHCSGVLRIQNKQYSLTSRSNRAQLHNNSRILHQSFDTMLAPNFTGYENIAFAKFDYDPSFSFVKISKDILGEHERFDIPLEKEVALMSGGQRQMLALLMVTQKKIDLLLLDEPTAALDSKNSDYVMQGVRKLAQEKNICIVCISHDADLVKKHADYTIAISEQDNGKKIFEVNKGYNR